VLTNVTLCYAFLCHIVIRYVIVCWVYSLPLRTVARRNICAVSGYLFSYFFGLKNRKPMLRYVSLFHVMLPCVTLRYIWGYTTFECRTLYHSFPTSCCLTFIAWKIGRHEVKTITTCWLGVTGWERFGKLTERGLKAIKESAWHSVPTKFTSVYFNFISLFPDISRETE